MSSVNIFPLLIAILFQIYKNTRPPAGISATPKADVSFPCKKSASDALPAISFPNQSAVRSGFIFQNRFVPAPYSA